MLLCALSRLIIPVLTERAAPSLYIGRLDQCMLMQALAVLHSWSSVGRTYMCVGRLDQCMLICACVLHRHISLRRYVCVPCIHMPRCRCHSLLSCVRASTGLYAYVFNWAHSHTCMHACAVLAQPWCCEVTARTCHQRHHIPATHATGMIDALPLLFPPP